MRSATVWLLTLTSGFFAFLLIATLALLPSEATRNQSTFSTVSQFAHNFADERALPRNPEADDRFAETFKGLRVWPSLPRGCRGDNIGPLSDRFEVGFWENGAADRFGGKWWQCYSFPSGRTSMPLTVRSYLNSSVGPLLAAYAAIAFLAAILATLIGGSRQIGLLRFRAKVGWLAASLAAVTLFDALQDSADDQFFETDEPTKWFVIVFEHFFPWLLLAAGTWLLICFVCWWRRSTV